MTNEKRIIYADDLEKALENTPVRIASEKAKMFQLINEAPTVDAEKVVRCKVCRHRGYVEVCPMCWEEFPEYDENGGPWFDGITHDRTVDEGFCDRGERSSDG